MAFGLEVAGGQGAPGVEPSMPHSAGSCRWEHRGGHLRLLVTDPFHPVTAVTATALRDSCEHCRIVGVAPDVAGSAPPPPGLDAVVACPRETDESFPSAVLEVAHRAGCDLVLPWSDRDALALAGSAGMYRGAGVSLLCPGADLVALACDKWAMVQRLAEVEVPVAASMLVRDGRGLYLAAEAMGYPARRLVLKPRRLSGGRGVWLLKEGADPFAGGFPPELPVEAMAVAVDEWGRRAHLDGLILQEQLDGEDVSVDVLADDGTIVVAVARSRTASLGGLCVEGTVRPLSAAEWSVVETITGRLQWSSLANVQLVAGRSGPAVYEINARAAGSVGISAHAGVDLLAAAITLARTGTAAGYGAEVVRETNFRRHWVDQCWPARLEIGG